MTICLKKGLSTYGSTTNIEYQKFTKHVHGNVHDFCAFVMQLHSM